MKRLLSGLLIALALCCALAGRTATVSAAPATVTTMNAATLDDPPSCEQIYQSANAQAWANYDYCVAHSPGSLQWCVTALEANLAANWVWYTLNC